MSPEQATGKLDQIGPATDIYCLGVTLFELLTGQVPHPDKEVGVVLERISQGEVVEPSQRVDWIPPPLEAICLKAMAHKPPDRYISVRRLSDDIERWLADERVLAHEENWIERSGRWMRQHRTFVVTAVVAQMLLGAVLTIALLVWSNHYQHQRHQRELELQRQQLLGTSEFEDTEANK